MENELLEYHNAKKESKIHELETKVKIESIMGEFWFEKFKKLMRTSVEHVISDVAYCSIGKSINLGFELLDIREDEELNNEFTTNAEFNFVSISHDYLQVFKKFGDPFPTVHLTYPDIKEITISCDHQAIR